MPQLLLGLGTQRPQEATGFKQWGAKLLGESPKGLATLYRACLGHTLEIIRRNQFGMYGKGDWRL